MTAVLLSLATFFSTALGGLFALRRRGQLYLIMAFSAGLLVAAALLDLLPNALDLAAKSGRSADAVLIAAGVGFILFYSLDHVVHILAAAHLGTHAGHAHHAQRHDEHVHEHEHDHAHDADEAAARPARGRGLSSGAGTIAALGLVIHSFLDGAAIGSAFSASSSIGVLVALAVIAHDFGDGVSTISIVLGSRGSLRASLGWLIADAVAPVVGAATPLLASISTGHLALLLGLFAGTFLVIGAVHLLPEAQHEEQGRTLPAFLAGCVIIFLATRITGA